MSLAVIGKGASYEFRWRSWALLRDTVAEYLEVDGATFPALSAIGDALVAGRVHVVAAMLAVEIERVREGLRGRTLDDLVIAPRTAAILHGGVTPKASRALTRIEVANIRHPGESTELSDYFATMLDSFARVCAHPNADGTLEVVDG